MYTITLQPWTYVASAGSTGFVYVTQEAPEYFDGSFFDSVVFYLELRKQTSLVFLDYETSPSKEDATFVEMARLPASGGMASLVGSTPTISTIQLSDAPSVPLARWVRWKLTFDSSGGDATFKITASFR